MKFAYIDESGTLEHQRVLTVALIVLNGKRTAERLHERIMFSLYADYVQRRTHLKQSNRLHALPCLHYAEMDRAQRNQTAAILRLAKVPAFVKHYYHDGPATTHERRFDIYCALSRL